MLLVVRVEAVVADLDGTVVRSDFSVSAATLSAIDLVRSAGIAFVVATARTPQGLEHFQVLARRSTMAVCCSGAIGWSSIEQALMWMVWMTPAAIGRVVEIAAQEGAGVASFDGRLWRMTDEYHRLSPTQPHGPTRVVVDSSVVAETPCCTMAVRQATGDLDRIAGLVAAEADSAALSHVGRSTVLDVTAQGVDKGTGTCRALEELGLAASSAISFGDMPNDLAMFRVTGRSYSVGSSDPGVMTAASEVIPSVEDDGFARKIVDLAAAGWVIEESDPAVVSSS
ncbi:MAG TPA: HAD hydrolase family protein [Candidatus Saccharimonadales bacterium]|nr:HAD hydrolase family protein [Candidatus Saccharimonadales bacterium]